MCVVLGSVNSSRRDTLSPSSGYNVEKIGVLVGEVLQGFEEQAGAASSKS